MIEQIVYYISAPLPVQDEPATGLHVPLLSFGFKAPVDGLPCLKDWGQHAISIWSLGYEAWREAIEIRPGNQALLGQPCDYGTIEACKGTGRVSMLLFTVLYTYLEMKDGLSPEEMAGFKKNLGY